MGFESERVAGIDHDARHGDRYERLLNHVRAFLNGTVTGDFSVTANERYDFVARTVRRFGYARLKRADKGVVLRFLQRVSGYSRQ